MSIVKAHAVFMAKTQARQDAYARYWTDRPIKEAARHFGVSNRTIGRWRERLGLTDVRPGRPVSPPIGAGPGSEQE